MFSIAVTLSAVREKLEQAKPRSMRVAVLLSKKKQRAREVGADYVGFEIEDKFLVGYGLDFMERYRNLPYIGVLRKELLGRGWPVISRQAETSGESSVN